MSTMKAVIAVDAMKAMKGLNAVKAADAMNAVNAVKTSEAAENTETEDAAWADEEELLLVQADMAGAAVRTWLVPEVCDMDRCLRDWYMPRILQEMNAKLAAGDLSALLRLPVVSERITSVSLRPGGTAYWRLNRTDFLADVEVGVNLTVEKDGEDIPGAFAFCLSLWFCTEGGFRFEVEELRLAEDRPERSFWKLDRHLVPILRRDEVESGADRIWERYLPDKKDPKERNARMLAEAMGLSLRELRLFGQGRTRAILCFQDTVLQVQEEMGPDDDTPPAPVPATVAAGTIVLNSAAPSGGKGCPEILHE